MRRSAPGTRGHFGDTGKTSVLYTLPRVVPMSPHYYVSLKKGCVLSTLDREKCMPNLETPFPEWGHGDKIVSYRRHSGKCVPKVSPGARLGSEDL